MIVPAGRRLVVEILNMDMDCPFDYVALLADNALGVLTLCPLNTVQPCKHWKLLDIIFWA